ncbi:MAG: Clo7bot family Cys-rich peptide [Thermoanaerobacteraceae bacterium]
MKYIIKPIKEITRGYCIWCFGKSCGNVCTNNCGRVCLVDCLVNDAGDMEVNNK